MSRRAATFLLTLLALFALPGDALVSSRTPSARDPATPAPHATKSALEARAPKATTVSRPRSVAAGGRQAAAAPTLSSTFNGLDRYSGRTRATATAPFHTHVPPDTIVASNGSTLLEGVNAALRLFSTFNPPGGVIDTKDLRTFFGAASADGFFADPHVVFDRDPDIFGNPGPRQRYYVVAIQRTGSGDMDPANNRSALWLAVSRSGNPGALGSDEWCRYRFDGKRNVGTAQESVADYPGLGTGPNFVLVTDNQITFAPNPVTRRSSFTFSMIRAFDKEVVANNAASCPFPRRWLIQSSITVKDGTAFTITPVQQLTRPSVLPDGSNPHYLLNTNCNLSTDICKGTDNRVNVWQIRCPTPSPGSNRCSVGSSPTVSRTTVAGNFPYIYPENGPTQPGTNEQLISGDTRMLSAVGNRNSVSGANTTECNFATPPPDPKETCWLYTRLTAGGGVTTRLDEQQLAGLGANTHAWMPGIAVNLQDQVVATVQVSNKNRFLGAMAFIKNKDAPWSTGFNLAWGSCARTGPPSVERRTGDYTGAHIDPGDVRSFWVAGERATAVPNLNGCNWATRIGRISP